MIGYVYQYDALSRLLVFPVVVVVVDRFVVFVYEALRVKLQAVYGVDPVVVDCVIAWTETKSVVVVWVAKQEGWLFARTPNRK